MIGTGTGSTAQVPRGFGHGVMTEAGVPAGAAEVEAIAGVAAGAGAGQAAGGGAGVAAGAEVEAEAMAGTTGHEEGHLCLMSL